MAFRISTDFYGRGKVEGGKGLYLFPLLRFFFLIYREQKWKLLLMFVKRVMKKNKSSKRIDFLNFERLWHEI